MSSTGCTRGSVQGLLMCTLGVASGVSSAGGDDVHLGVGTSRETEVCTDAFPFSLWKSTMFFSKHMSLTTHFDFDSTEKFNFLFETGGCAAWSSSSEDEEWTLIELGTSKFSHLWLVPFVNLFLMKLFTLSKNSPEPGTSSHHSKHPGSWHFAWSCSSWQLLCLPWAYRDSP